MGKVIIPRGFDKYLELKNCGVCGKNDYNIKYKIPRGFYHPDKYFSISWVSPWKIPVWNIVECKNCGFVWTNPAVKEKYLPFLYPDKIFVNEETGMVRGKNTTSLWTTELKDIVQLTKLVPTNAAFLDVGCANGFSLKAAEKIGFKKINGVEISQKACKYAKEELKLENVFCGTLQEAKFPDNFFDLIILYDVLEHVPNPRKLLKETYRILKADGHVVLKQMDVNSEQSKRYGKRWTYIAPAAHLYYFSKSSISRLTKEIGFSLVGISADKALPYTFRKRLREKVKKLLWPIIIRKRGLKTQDICCHQTPLLFGQGQDSMMRVVCKKPS